MGEIASTKLLLSTTRPGPFIGGSSHAILTLGQRPIIESLTEEELEEQEALGDERGSTAAGNAGASAGAGRGRGRGRGRGWSAASRKARVGGVPTLQDLIEAGIIIPGRSNIAVSYKGTTYTASLEKDGAISYQGKSFQSATSFSIHCKRMQTPNKQGDDGWKSVLYEGQPLELYRRRYSARPRAAQPRRGSAASAPSGDEEMPSAEDGGKSEANTPTPISKASGAAPAAAAPEPETDQWVQCDRCRTWRVVPAQHWPSVEADTSEEWFCESANWNVALSHPFTPSCAA